MDAAARRGGLLAAVQSFDRTKLKQATPVPRNSGEGVSRREGDSSEPLSEPRSRVASVAMQRMLRRQATDDASGSDEEDDEEDDSRLPPPFQRRDSSKLFSLQALDFSDAELSQSSDHDDDDTPAADAGHHDGAGAGDGGDAGEAVDGGPHGERGDGEGGDAGTQARDSSVVAPSMPGSSRVPPAPITGAENVLTARPANHVTEPSDNDSTVTGSGAVPITRSASMKAPRSRRTSLASLPPVPEGDDDLTDGPVPSPTDFVGSAASHSGDVDESAGASLVTGATDDSAGCDTAGAMGVRHGIAGHGNGGGPSRGHLAGTSATVDNEADLPAAILGDVGGLEAALSTLRAISDHSVTQATEVLANAVVAAREQLSSLRARVHAATANAVDADEAASRARARVARVEAEAAAAVAESSARAAAAEASTARAVASLRRAGIPPAAVDAAIAAKSPVPLPEDVLPKSESALKLARRMRESQKKLAAALEEGRRLSRRVEELEERVDRGIEDKATMEAMYIGKVDDLSAQLGAAEARALDTSDELSALRVVCERLLAWMLARLDPIVFHLRSPCKRGGSCTENAVGRAERDHSSNDGIGMLCCWLFRAQRTCANPQCVAAPDGSTCQARAQLAAARC